MKKVVTGAKVLAATAGVLLLAFVVALVCDSEETEADEDRRLARQTCRRVKQQNMRVQAYAWTRRAEQAALMRRHLRQRVRA